MYIFCIVLILIASILLILAVLAQNPKSGMAANFGASNQVMGVRQTADFLEKIHLGAGYFHRSTEPDRNDDHAVGQHFVEQKRRRKSAGTIAGKQRKPDAAGIAGSRTGRSRSGTDDGLCKIDVSDPAAAIGRFRRTFYEFIQKRCPTEHVEHLFHFPAT